MVPALLLLVAVVAAYLVHVKWGKADQRNLETQPEQETWDDIADFEATDRNHDAIVSNAARERANRHSRN
ncbi:MAG TPA: hypothetical protein VEQ10_04270 [Vicinamibacteria bacterium]|nr:hypothetical protein [Vicinamibacteria bacterium]